MYCLIVNERWSKNLNLSGTKVAMRNNNSHPHFDRKSTANLKHYKYALVLIFVRLSCSVKTLQMSVIHPAGKGSLSQ